MSTLQKALTALVVMSVLVSAPPAHAQAATAGRRAAVTTRLGAPVPSADLRIRSVPIAWRGDRHVGLSDRGVRGPRGNAYGFARHSTTVFVPYATTYVERSTAYDDAALLDALEEVRDAALDAREAALDAREAALDARAATGRAPAPSGGKVLTWKPGGITPVDAPGRSGDASRIVILEPRASAVSPPPAKTHTSAAASVRVRMTVPVVPLLARDVPWWVPTECASPLLPRQQQQARTQDRRRFPWGLGWLARYGRDVEVERGHVAPPSFYMRSPLLSGLYRRADCPPGDEVAERCAEVTLVADDDAAIAFEVPLPQLDAATAGSLRENIRAALDEGETVVLRTTDGEEFDLMPGAVREVGAGACRID